MAIKIVKIKTVQNNEKIPSFWTFLPDILGNICLEYVICFPCKLFKIKPR